MEIKALILAAAAASCFAAKPGLAHHGAVAYDRESTLSLEATITAFDWENPHALIRFETDGDGTAHEWVAETAGLVILVRAGWNNQTLQPGDRCTVVGHPAKNGSHTMILQRVVLADGRELGNYIP
ncbi:MAG TPA: DUF6152 family protein [Gammaproteobacteria bacterium]|jgi:hypothetical protein